jgi:hypothetical protein
MENRQARAKKLTSAKRFFSASNEKVLALKAKHQKAAASKAFFWNYNTVEASLLFCAMLILLGGLMFQDQTAIIPGSKKEESLFWIIMLIVVGSIFYFFVVLMTEIGVGLGWKWCAFGTKQFIKKRSSTDAESLDISGSNPMTNPKFAADNAEEARKLEMKQKLDESLDLLAQTQQQLADLKKETSMNVLTKKANRGHKKTKQPNQPFRPHDSEAEKESWGVFGDDNNVQTTMNPMSQVGRSALTKHTSQNIDVKKELAL